MFEAVRQCPLNSPIMGINEEDYDFGGLSNVVDPVNGVSCTTKYANSNPD